MKVLWLTASIKPLKKGSNFSSYNGGGWVSSLQRLIEDVQSIELGIAYVTDKVEIIEKIGNTTYYPIRHKKTSQLEKICKYYGYKKHNTSHYVAELQTILNDFKPDIIHLFGLENSMASILANSNVPVVVHIQGLLGPYDNAFFPQGINNWSFLFPITKREWILRNGYVFAKKDIHRRGIQEAEVFSKLKYCMGRTHWDCHVVSLLAPAARYYHVNEVLRESFYAHKDQWKHSNGDTLVITSTLSDTMYKGLDLILKTARMLKQHTAIRFVWNVVGIGESAMLVRFFERSLHLKSCKLNIKYLGVMDEEELCNILLTSGVYVHTSYIDNSPNSLCEAQMLGLPVIGTYVGGVPTLIEDGITGTLVPANAPYELAWHILQLATKPQTYLQMAEVGSRRAKERHDKEKILHNLIETYQSVVSIEADN